jgi:hypothetical protein
MINTINIGINIFEKLPEDIQLYTHTYYPLITNRIIQRNLVKYNIPNEIQYLILTYLNINYTFDQDIVYFYFTPLVFIVDDKLQVSVYSWYGCHTPDNYKPGNILHTVFDRPYPIQLERKFGNIARNIYKDIKHFNFSKDIIEGLFEFSGTYGPLKDGLKSRGGVYFNRLSNAGWHFSTPDLLNYFKEMNILDYNIENLTTEVTTEALNSLKEFISKSVQKSMISFKNSANNRVNGPFVKNMENNSKILFYKICKNKSNQQVIIEKNMLRQITR